MRTIKNLLKNEKKVYIYLNSKAIRYRFMSDAELEGITYGDGVLPTEREVEDIMSLHSDGTICFLGFAGRMFAHYNKRNIIRIDYEKYIDNERVYVIAPEK
ncbi:MAG: hypothetical protein IJM97_05265 [Clostridia bacterium]|nr:hypothetical protein [Clostridia bacterium]